MYAKINKYICEIHYWESYRIQNWHSVPPYQSVNLSPNQSLHRYIAKSRFAGSFLELYNRKSRQAEKIPFVGFVVYFTTTRSILNGVIAFTACGMPAGMMMD